MSGARWPLTHARAGQVYSFWGGFLVSSREIGSPLSRVRWVKSKYRQVRKCGVFVCRDCAARIRRGLQ